MQETKTAIVSRHFTREGVDPYDEITWSTRDAEIKDFKTGDVIFSQQGMEFPETWSDTAVKVVAQKYFAGRQGTTARETSARQMIDRVVSWIASRGAEDGYLDEVSRGVFADELKHILVNQFASFNSPVWFNVGVPNTNGQWCYSAAKKKAVLVKDDMIKPQVSACFILQVEDSMEDILEHYVREGNIFANGSGAGVNLSSLRASVEYLSGGGKASGPVSFERGWDTSAGTIKSGGKTRRAAKMVILNVDHPDIEEFIHVKVRQEKIARDLIAAGYDPGFNVAGGAYDIVGFQNANHSVRVSDEFMRAAQKNQPFWTKLVKDGKRWKEYKATDLLKQIAQAAWECGDPGMQFDTIINDYNTCADTERIVASNPCSEYMFLNDSACNLASLNLMKFAPRAPGESFDWAGFRHAVSVLILAQDILVDNGGYPTEKIAFRSHQYRTLGLGFANLGALLMVLGLPYDSDRGRQLAGHISSVMTGQAYLTSARIAKQMGPFPTWDKNHKSALHVLLKHSSKTIDLGFQLATEIWDEAVSTAESYGIRNAQVTVLAPTGTISFMMDCATTGIEPELGLVKYKTLVGGGTLKLVNPLVRAALQEGLKYPPDHVEAIVKHVEEFGTVDGAPHIHALVYDVFDTSFPAGPNNRSIHYMGHVKMMAAVQPFISGAISKTVNLPHNATAEDILEVYQTSWELGLKAVAVYRDGCKGSQPLNTTDGKTESKALTGPHQRKLVGDRNAIVHEFKLNGHKGFLVVGLYEDGTPGEIFVDISKEGSTISGLMDTIAILTSFCLQYGVPLRKLVDKFRFMSFEPGGYTGIPEIGFAKSLPDYIFRWLELKFLPKEEGALELAGVTEMKALPAASAAPVADCPPCSNCGSMTIRNGTCHVCPQCATTTGCS